MLRRLRGLEGSGLDDSGLDGSGLDGSDLDGPGLDGSTWRAVFVEGRDRAFSIVARQQLWINPTDAKARGSPTANVPGGISRHLSRLCGPWIDSIGGHGLEAAMDWKH